MLGGRRPGARAVADRGQASGTTCTVWSASVLTTTGTTITATATATRTATTTATITGTATPRTATSTAAADGSEQRWCPDLAEYTAATTLIH